MKFLKATALNIFLIFVFLYVIAWAASSMLNAYTRHGQSLTLPNLKGLKFEEAEQLLKSKNLRYIITDTAFVDEFPKNAIVGQNPEPNTKVKEGRIIYITLNSNSTLAIEMPNLINSSQRYAESVLESVGLKLGSVIYRPDIATGAVLDMLYKNKSIQPNTKIPKGAIIDLIVADGTGSTMVPMPNLAGLSLADAKSVLQSSQLSIGAIVYEGEIKDTVNTKVKRQNPEFVTDGTIRSGESVDLFLSAE